MHILNNRHIRLNPNVRLHNCTAPIIGLTGGIATGKSTVSHYLQNKGFHIIDADRLIKDIYTQQQTIDYIGKISLNVVIDGEINFDKLRELFYSNQKMKSDVEHFLYQKLPHQFQKAVSRIDFAQCNFIIYDVPLLFEKNLDTKVDQSIVVYAPKLTQVERIKKRDDHSDEIIEKIIGAQLPIDEKKSKADFLIDNSGSLEELCSGIEKIIQNLCE